MLLELHLKCLSWFQLLLLLLLLLLWLLQGGLHRGLGRLMREMGRSRQLLMLRLLCLLGLLLLGLLLLEGHRGKGGGISDEEPPIRGLH